MATPTPDQSNGGLCPCGSGLPYQQCCGATANQERSPQAPDKRQLAVMLGQARRAVRAGETQRAEKMCTEILGHDGSHLGALRLLVGLRRAANDTQNVERLLTRLRTLYPNNDEVMVDTAEFMLSQGRVPQAQQMLATAARRNPRNFRTHVDLGRLGQLRGDNASAEYHFRQAHYLRPSDAGVCAALAGVLNTLGRHDESERFYRIAYNLQPANSGNLLNWVKLEESRGDMEQAEEILEQARHMEGDHALLPLSEALLKHRRGEIESAARSLEEIEMEKLHPAAAAAVQFERGHILDQLGRYDDAFDACSDANRMHREQLRMNYADERVRKFVEDSKRFFTRSQMERLPRAVASSPNDAEPIFIVGFPRSGASLVEQILSAHPNISAAGELHYIPSGAVQTPAILRSKRPYPDCLDELNLRGNERAVQQMRNRYLMQGRLDGVLKPGSRRFTDKMPLNESYLGYIHLMFPEAPIIHVVRHPMDTVLSCFFNDVRHGDLFSFSLESCATHYLRCMELVEHYLDNLDLRYHRVRYEDLVSDAGAQAGEVLKFLGDPWNDRCLEFHKHARYTGIPSYSRAPEPVYSHAVNRHKHYKHHVKDVQETLKPVIAQLGYD